MIRERVSASHIRSNRALVPDTSANVLPIRQKPIGSYPISRRKFSRSVSRSPAPSTIRPVSRPRTGTLFQRPCTRCSNRYPASVVTGRLPRFSITRYDAESQTSSAYRRIESAAGTSAADTRAVSAGSAIRLRSDRSAQERQKTDSRMKKQTLIAIFFITRTLRYRTVRPRRRLTDGTIRIGMKRPVRRSSAARKTGRDKTERVIRPVPAGTDGTASLRL